MERHLIEVGKHYAIREPPVVGAAFERVEVLEEVRPGRWKVEWIDPHPGLVDYLKSRSIICQWGQRKSIQRDEERENRLQAHVERTWPGEGDPLSEAALLVLEATGERSCWLHKGVLEFDSAAMKRICDRAGVDLPTHPAGYVTRDGRHRLPYECGVEVARSFASAEPNSVLTLLEADERRLESDVREPGNAFLVDRLNTMRAQWALVRQWAGHDEAIAARDARIKELEDLLSRIVWDLRREGVDPQRVATRLARALAGR